MEAFQGRLLRFPTVRKPVVLAVSSALGLVILGLTSSRLFGLGRTLQLIVTLVIPAAVMFQFWRVAKDRIRERESELETMLELERATFRAANEFVASVSHELTPHPERCSLRAESLAVAIDYRPARRHIKVAVPDVVIMTDPYFFRQVLHTLVSNAVKHGGERVAVWATVSESTVDVTVSDDGPGVAKGLGDHLFERFADLGAQALGSPGAGTGLSIARELARLMGGEMSYRRDASWSHFSLRLPIGNELAESEADLAELEAQVG